MGENTSGWFPAEESDHRQAPAQSRGSEERKLAALADSLSQSGLCSAVTVPLSIVTAAGRELWALPGSHPDQAPCSVSFFADVSSLQLFLQNTAQVQALPPRVLMGRRGDLLLARTEAELRALTLLVRQAGEETALELYRHELWHEGQKVSLADLPDSGDLLQAMDALLWLANRRDHEEVPLLEERQCRKRRELLRISVRETASGPISSDPAERWGLSAVPIPAPQLPALDGASIPDKVSDIRPVLSALPRQGTLEAALLPQLREEEVVMGSVPTGTGEPVPADLWYRWLSERNPEEGGESGPEEVMSCRGIAVGEITAGELLSALSEVLRRDGVPQEIRVADPLLQVLLVPLCAGAGIRLVTVPALDALEEAAAQGVAGQPGAVPEQAGEEDASFGDWADEEDEEYSADERLILGMDEAQALALPHEEFLRLGEYAGEGFFHEEVLERLGQIQRIRWSAAAVDEGRDPDDLAEAGAQETAAAAYTFRIDEDEAVPSGDAQAIRLSGQSTLQELGERMMTAAGGRLSADHVFYLQGHVGAEEEQICGPGTGTEDFALRSCDLLLEDLALLPGQHLALVSGELLLHGVVIGEQRQE